ncbi:MAG: hypothetical protein PWR01_1843 [Clostridiales bacterium]|nr:hypothetical protein [Clostridiales bacterium]
MPPGSLVVLGQMNLFLKLLFLPLQEPSHFMGRDGSLGQVGITIFIESWFTEVLFGISEVKGDDRQYSVIFE